MAAQRAQLSVERLRAAGTQVVDVAVQGGELRRRAWDRLGDVGERQRLRRVCALGLKDARDDRCQDGERADRGESLSHGDRISDGRTHMPHLLRSLS
jgi:hypothetical protein